MEVKITFSEENTDVLTQREMIINIPDVDDYEKHHDNIVHLIKHFSKKNNKRNIKITKSPITGKVQKSSITSPKKNRK